VPYDPHVQYRGDEYLYQGITGASEDIAKHAAQALKDYEKNKQEREVSDWAIERLAQTPDSTGKPIVSIDDLNEYHNANSNRKATIFRSVVTTGAMLAHRQLQDLEAQKAADEHTNIQSEITARQAEETRRKAAAAGVITPIDEFGQPIDPTNPKSKVAALRQPDGQIHFLPKPSPLDEVLAHFANGDFRGGGNKSTFNVGDKTTPPAGQEGDKTTPPAGQDQTVISHLKALAQKALLDPKATPDHKAAAKRMLGQ
jgi:hypothetical protein